MGQNFAFNIAENGIQLEMIESNLIIEKKKKKTNLTSIIFVIVVILHVQYTPMNCFYIFNFTINNANMISRAICIKNQGEGR